MNHLGSQEAVFTVVLAGDVMRMCVFRGTIAGDVMRATSASSTTCGVEGE